MFRIYLLFILIFSASCQPKKVDPVITYAGSQTSGFTDGPREEASFYNPSGIAVDESGNIFVADSQNHAIRKIDSNGRVTTVAGTGKPGYEDGPKEKAQFFFPTSITIDKKGNLYVADTRNQLIRMIKPNGEVSTLAGKSRPLFQNPEGIAVDHDNNVYVSDHTDRIYKITSSGTVSIFAGSGIPGWLDGESSTARFFVPRGLAFDGEENLYVADSFNNRIRKIDPSGRVSTVAGTSKKGRRDGLRDSAKFFHPYGLSVDNESIFVADLGNQLIRKIDKYGNVITFAGNGLRGATNSTFNESSFWNPIWSLYHQAIDYMFLII
ncbi:MAG: NHL repeat-containing protein [Cyclobacteriaceae bacterium]